MKEALEEATYFKEQLQLFSDNLYNTKLFLKTSYFFYCSLKLYAIYTWIVLFIISSFYTNYNRIFFPGYRQFRLF